jgi:hypothetical protein
MTYYMRLHVNNGGTMRLMLGDDKAKAMERTLRYVRERMRIGYTYQQVTASAGVLMRDGEVITVRLVVE